MIFTNNLFANMDNVVVCDVTVVVTVSISVGDNVVVNMDVTVYGVTAVDMNVTVFSTIDVLVTILCNCYY